MRIAKGTSLAVLGVLVWGGTSAPGGLWAQVIIHAHVEARAEWAPVQAEPDPEMDARDEMELEQPFQAFTNARVTLTWTMVPGGRSVGPPGDDRAEMITGSYMPVIDSPGGTAGAGTGRTGIRSGEDSGGEHASAGEIILTLSWL